MSNGHWLFSRQMGVAGYTGFVYVIRDYLSGHFYIGKKNYKVERGEHKGRESDWRTYMSSSKHLRELLLHVPKDGFQGIVLEEYSQKASLRYAETWSLCRINAPCNPLCFNVRIEEISWAIKEPPTDLHIERLTRATTGGNFREDYLTGLFEPT